MSCYYRTVQLGNETGMCISLWIFRDWSMLRFIIKFNLKFQNIMHAWFCVWHLWFTFGYPSLTHWGWVTHICVFNLTIIGSDNGLSPGRRQAIIRTNVGILLIGPLGTNFSEILIGIQAFSFKKMHVKMSSAKWRPFCLCLNVLNMWWATDKLRVDTQTRDQTHRNRQRQYPNAKSSLG